MSEVLRHIFSNLSPVAVAILDDGREGVALGTVPSATPHNTVAATLSKLAFTPGSQVGFQSVPLSANDIAQLDAYAGNLYTNTTHAGADGKWSAFLCQFENGCQDRIAIRVARDADETRLLGFLTVIWPVLREDCLQEIANAGHGIADEAMLWLIAEKMDLAVFVVNADGMMLRSNTAAKNMLDQAHVLKRSRDGILCSSDAQTRQLRDAIAACAAAHPDKADDVFFLTSDGPETVSHGARVPVTLSRFFHDGAPTSLVTMILPSPPDSRRVEVLAREMGLTQAEARVAALMQLGLSNREAAQVAGLTEQSLCTYAKRVLNKLNVASRAEVAQMLTWQAQGGTVS